MNMQHRIDDHINKIFSFKRVGEWYRDGRCPQCNKKSVYTNAITPRIVKCNHIKNCGYTEHVKDICHDIFKDWSKEFPKSKESPTASADAYLTHARGLDHTRLRGLYTQELFRNEFKFGNEVSATIRFKIAEGVYWERLIDRPERFGSQKANISGKVTGQHWTMHDIKTLAQADEIWLTEGIFNSIALSLSDLISSATISSNNYPTQLLEQIKNYCEAELKVLTRPKLIWAFDNDIAGKDAVLKFHQKATEEGWISSCALPVSKESELDWNDLYERELLTKDHIRKYKHFGQLHIAETANDAAMLIYKYYDTRLKNFHFVHKLKTYWFNLNSEKYDKELEVSLQNSDSTVNAEKFALERSSKIEQICNAQVKALYFQRDQTTDSSWYYFQIHTEKGIVKDTFSPEQITSKGNFTNRLLSIAPGAWWTGSDKQLQAIAQRETEHLKEVKTIEYIGYSKDYETYVFNKHAVHKGRVIHINKHDYYQVGKHDIKTLASKPEITLNDKDKFNPNWWQDYFKINGEKGLIILAWWTGSYFAEQIRKQHGAYPFLEYVGQAGSGKSSLIEFLWGLSGRNDKKEGINPNSSSVAAVHRSMAQVSNLPVVFIEGDRKDQKSLKQKFDWDELKDAYNGQNIRSRGLKTSGNETYEPPFKGAILMAQNDPINASEAILSRTLHISVDMKHHTYEKKLIADRLYKLEFEQACTYMTHCLKNEAKILETFFQKFAETEKHYHQIGITHTRITACHSQVSAMIDALQAHIFTDVIDLEEICNAQKMLEQMAIKRIDDLAADHKLVVQFWEAFEYMNEVQSINFKLNHYDSKHQFVAINLHEIYKAAARHFQALPDINEMRDLLKNSRRYKFVEMNKQVRSKSYPVNETNNIGADSDTPVKDRNVKCWIFTNPYFKQGK